MYIGRSPALAALRAALAQTGRELATVLVGLDAVRQGQADAPHAPWADDAERLSAVRHARRFACDAALGRVVDALDAYLAALRRFDAFAEGTPRFAAMQERSVKTRLEAVAEDLALDRSCAIELALAHLAIQWRNRRLHSGAANRLEQPTVAALRAGDEALRARWHGLEAATLLDHFDASRSPRHRELSALVRATGSLGERIDRAVAAAAPPVAYAEESLGRALREEGVAVGRKLLAELWSHPPEKRRAKLAQLLRAQGFREGMPPVGQEALSEAWLDALAHAGHRETAARFGLLEEREAAREGERGRPP